MHFISKERILEEESFPKRQLRVPSMPMQASAIFLRESERQAARGGPALLNDGEVQSFVGHVAPALACQLPQLRPAKQHTNKKEYKQERMNCG